MGYKEIDLKIHVSCDERELASLIRKRTHLTDFNYTILRKSLDARNKKNICWKIRIGIISQELTSGPQPVTKTLVPRFRKRNEHVVITGSGPAGYFAALFLLQSGFRVTITERGGPVEERKTAVQEFESSEVFDPNNNYAFGEGGAGTFSDGKLTSRTKSISAERNYIFQAFMNYGAPDEIQYLTHPHLGTNKLFNITRNMRQALLDMGCRILYNQRVEDVHIVNSRLMHCNIPRGNLEADYFIFATGHSAYDTYRMLINKGVRFRPKNFALGFRAEHRQDIINAAQWGVTMLPGVKAAEYRLTATSDDNTPVYSFCMCPGGKVVPATPFSHTNLVNGMSNYQRSSPWANAAIVAGINLNSFLKREISAGEALDWLERLEASYYDIHKSYAAPASTIKAFLTNGPADLSSGTSYPFGLFEADFNELLPAGIAGSLKQGLRQFCRKLTAYESGIIMGLESKTSSPVQVIRDPETYSCTFHNLFLAGEGSGWAGGIVSSAADGLKVAAAIAAKRPDNC